MTSHSSLNPEFDLANEAILDELAKTQEVDLVCEDCGTLYAYNGHNKPGMYCVTEIRGKQCGGQIWVDKDMIKLPDSIKTGKKPTQQNYNSGSGYVTGGSGTGYNTTVWESHKHPGDKIIFEHLGKKLYASNGHSIDEHSGKWDLIIDLAGVIRVSSNTDFIRGDSPKRFKDLSKFLDVDQKVPSEVLRLFWSDMGTPPCGIEFWQNMWKLLPNKTVVACVGGHGRTGTCIASLMIAAGENFQESLEHVRLEHCKKAVENLVQEQYLHAIYIERLQQELKAAKAEGKSKEVEKVVVLLEEAVKQKPTYKPSKWENKWEDKKDEKSTVIDMKTGEVLSEVKEGEQPMSDPFKLSGTGGNSADTECNCDKISSHLVPCPVHAETPEWANGMEQKIKTVGERIYVEECTHKLCTVPDCRNPLHQGWVEWDFTEEGVI